MFGQFIFGKMQKCIINSIDVFKLKIQEIYSLELHLWYTLILHSYIYHTKWAKRRYEENLYKKSYFRNWTPANQLFCVCFSNLGFMMGTPSLLSCFFLMNSSERCHSGWPEIINTNKDYWRYWRQQKRGSIEQTKKILNIAIGSHGTCIFTYIYLAHLIGDRLIPEQLLWVAGGILHVGPTKSLTFSPRDLRVAMIIFWDKGSQT